MSFSDDDELPLATLIAPKQHPKALDTTDSDDEHGMRSFIQIIAMGGMLNADSPKERAEDDRAPEDGPDTAEAHGLLVDGADRNWPAVVGSAESTGERGVPVPATESEDASSNESPASSESPGTLAIPGLSVETGKISPNKSPSARSSGSPQETVHRSTWAFRRSKPHPGAFTFVVPGDFGVTHGGPSGKGKGSAAGQQDKDKKIPGTSAKGKGSFDAFGKGIGKVWAKTVGLAKFGKSVMRPGSDGDADDEHNSDAATRSSPESSEASEKSPEVEEIAVATIQRFFRRHSSIKPMVEETQTGDVDASNEETQTDEPPTPASWLKTPAPTPIDRSADSAIVIQRAFRKHRRRDSVSDSVASERRKVAAKTIRKFWRGTKLRRELESRVNYERGRKEVAAVTLQKAWRNGRLRRHVNRRAAEKQRHRAAKTIAKAWTSYRLRRVVAIRIEVRTLPIRNQAAIQIQRAYRRQKTRHSIHSKHSLNRLGDLQRVDTNVVAAWRGKMLRSELAFRVARKRQLKNEMAVIIQRAWRDHVACKGPKAQLVELRSKAAPTISIKLEHQDSTLGSLPALSHRTSRIPVPSSTVTPTAPRRMCHSRRDSDDSTHSRASISSYNSRYSVGPGGWNPRRQLSREEFPLMDWETKEEYKNQPKDDLPKFQFAKGGGLFSDYGYLAMSPVGSPSPSEKQRKASGRSLTSDGSGLLRSRAETPSGWRSPMTPGTPMGSRKPSAVFRKTSLADKEGYMGGLPEVQRNVSRTVSRGK